MTIIPCSHCGSDVGFKVVEDRLVCKHCFREHATIEIKSLSQKRRVEYQTMRDHAKAKGLWVEGL